MAIATLAATLLTLCAAAQRAPHVERAVGSIASVAWPYLPGSILPVRVEGFPVPYHVALVGPGALLPGGVYEIPADATAGTALLIAGSPLGLAAKTIDVGNPPSPERDFVAVACYEDGIVFHDGLDFSILGLFATGGAPADAAIDRRGRIATADTQGTTATVTTLDPWSVARVAGVPLGDGVAIDETTGAVFVTDRDIDGHGALTRINADGGVSHVVTGATAEGLAIDERRQIVYVANVNDDSVSAVNALTMEVLRRFHAVARIFSLTLSPDGTRLYGISNQSAGSPFAAPGSAVAIALDRTVPRVVARSAALTF